MKKVQIIISAILLTTFMACHETDKKDNVTNDADTAVVKQDDEISSKEKQATNWNELDWNSPVIKYDEVKSKDVSIRGNDNYAIYSVEEKVLFNSGQSTIRKQAEQNLNEIASAIASHSKGDIRVYGYTDSTDTKESNKELSQKRAEAVRNYLISKGNIPENRISVYAEGEDNPVATNSTSQGRQQNRRVEIVAMNNFRNIYADDYGFSLKNRTEKNLGRVNVNLTSQLLKCDWFCFLLYYVCTGKLAAFVGVGGVGGKPRFLASGYTNFCRLYTLHE